MNTNIHGFIGKLSGPRPLCRVTDIIVSNSKLRKGKDVVSLRHPNIHQSSDIEVNSQLNEDSEEIAALPLGSYQTHDYKSHTCIWESSGRSKIGPLLGRLRRSGIASRLLHFHPSEKQMSEKMSDQNSTIINYNWRPRVVGEVQTRGGYKGVMVHLEVSHPPTSSSIAWRRWWDKLCRVPG